MTTRYIHYNQPDVPQRGQPVKVGNVYEFFKTHLKRKYRWQVVAAVHSSGRPWNNVVLLHVTEEGKIAGASMVPEAYVQGHKNFVGKVEMYGGTLLEFELVT